MKTAKYSSLASSFFFSLFVGALVLAAGGLALVPGASVVAVGILALVLAAIVAAAGGFEVISASALVLMGPACTESSPACRPENKNSESAT